MIRSNYNGRKDLILRTYKGSLYFFIKDLIIKDKEGDTEVQLTYT